jgi:hypothetical protein
LAIKVSFLIAVNIVALALANLIGGLFVIGHNVSLFIFGQKIHCSSQMHQFMIQSLRFLLFFSLLFSSSLPKSLAPPMKHSTVDGSSLTDHQQGRIQNI